MLPAAALLLLLLVLLVSPSAAAPLPCTLRCMLDLLSATPADRNTTGVARTVALRSLSCEHPNVTSAPETLRLPATAEGLPALWARAHLTWKSCTASWELLGSPAASGDVAFAVDLPQMQGNASVRLEGGLASRAVLDWCDAGPVGVTVTSLSNETHRAEVLAALEGAVGPALCESMAFVLSNEDAGPTAALLAAASSARSALVPAVPPTNLAPPPEGASRMDNNAVARALEWLLNDVVGTELLNDIMTGLTNGTARADANITALGNARAIFNGFVDYTSVSLTYNLDQLAALGVNSFTLLDVLRPDENDNWTLASRIAMREIAANLTFDLDVTHDRRHENLQHARVRVHIRDPWLVLRLRIAVNGSALGQLTTPNLVNYTCFLKDFMSVNVTQAVMNGTVVGDDAFAITTEFPDWALPGTDEVDRDLAPFVDVLGVAFSDSYREVAMPLASAAWLSRVRDTLTYQIGVFINNALGWTCDYKPEPKDAPGMDPVATGSAFAVAVALALIIVVGMTLYSRNVSRRAARVLSVDGEDAYVVPSSSPLLPSADGKEVSSQPPLISHPGLSVAVRYVMPLLVLANMALFITSNRGIGASVFPKVRLGGWERRFGSMFDFGLVNTITDMWTAGVYPISILVAVFSGGWPYAKLAAMLVCWCAPPALLAVRRRELILMALDALGKWSMVDSYIMVLMLVAFRIHFGIPERPGQPETSGDIDIIVSAREGFTTFLLATISSLILGHIIVALHRHVERSAARREAAMRRGVDVNRIECDESCVRAVPLRSLAFARGEPNWAVAQVSVAALLLASIGMLLYGIIVDSVRFEIGGAAGLALDLSGGHRTNSYSIWNMGIMVPESCEDPSSFAAIITMTAFVVTTVVVPLLHLIVLVLLWFVPLSLAKQRAAFIFAEVCNAWCAIEVYTISVIFALLEIGQFAGFMVGDKCNAVNPWLERLLDKPLKGNDICFEVNAEVLPGTWVMLAASVVYLIASYIVMRRCHKALHDREPYNRIN